MSNEAYTSISNRVMSLEDIIRQQEQTIGAVLQRLRDVEQYAASEARNREQAQQQLYQVLGERGGRSAEAAQQMQAILQNQNERLGALQADVQGQAAALRGVDDKYGAALRGLEQRMQADVGGVHQRVQTGETASMEAMRSLQAQLQGVVNATQTVDTRSRDDLLALQQQLGAELAAQRQRTDNLEDAIRNALRDVHGSLTGELHSAGVQHRTELDGAVQRVNQSLEVLDQRTRADMNQLHSVEQGDVNELGRRIEDLERNLREVLQASTNGLANEVAQVAQHSQNLDRRQAAAHQVLLQELAKHDGQLETVDLNWRASVTDLNAMVRESVAAVQEKAVAGDQTLQRQLKAIEDRFTAAADTLTRNLNDLGHAVQENCVKPLNEVQRTLTAQDQRLSRVADEYATVQDSMKTFASRVDQDASQFKQVVEAAMRALHADLLERINLTSAAIAMQQDPETLRVEVSRALAKLWEDAKGAFLTQRSLNDVRVQLAALESAVRVELCALAERNVTKAVYVPYEAVTAMPSPEKRTTEATTKTLVEREPPVPARTTPASLPLSSSPPPPPSSLNPPRRSSPSQTDKSQDYTSHASQADEPLPLPLPPLQALTEPSSHAPLPSRPTDVEEIERDTYEEENEDKDERVRNGLRLQQHEKDINDLRASLNRLRLAQARETDQKSVAAVPLLEDGVVERGAVMITDVDGAVREAQQAASRADGASHEAKTAATQANRSLKEATSAAASAAKSVKAAEAAHNETVQLANELRLALKRVEMMEETFQQRLAELYARERASDARPSSDPTSQDALTPVPAVCRPRPSSLSSDAYAEVKKDEGGERNAGSCDEPLHASRVNAVTTALVSYSPQKAIRPASAPERPPAPKVPSPPESLIEVPGISKGGVFIVRQEQLDRNSPASLLPQSSFNAQPPLAPASAKESATSAHAKSASPSDSENSLQPPPRRASGLSEVLLPTHQFVRKREYNSFKDFTKKEIDAVWVELLNVRRNQGMSKEDVLLLISQSKEQLLNTVLQIVQRQESETLGMLSSIKMQLTSLNYAPAAMPEVKVFPIDNGKHLEELMRSIVANTPKQSIEPVVISETRALSKSSSDEVAARKAASPASSQRQAPLSAPERRTSPRPTSDVNQRAAQHSAPVEITTERDVDTAPSSARSASPLVPQIIPQVVQRRSNKRRKEEVSEVFFAASDHSYPQQLISEPQRSELDSSPPLTTTQSAPQQARQNVVGVSANPLSAAPASQPAEPESGMVRYRPKGSSPPPQKVVSPIKGSRSSSARIDTPQRLSSIPSSTPDPSPHHIILPYGTAGVPTPSPSQHIYQMQGVNPLGGATKRFLTEGKSPRNLAGNAFHLNPLQSVTSDADSTQKSPPQREPGARRESQATRKDPQMLGRKVLEDEPKPHDSRPPRYQLIQVNPPLQPLRSIEDVAPAPPLTDTSPEKYQPMSIEDGNEIYYASVENQRLSPRRSLHRSPYSAGNASMRHSGDVGTVRSTLPPGHLYKQFGSASSKHSRCRDSERRQEPQYSPLLPSPKPYRDHTPARSPSTDAVRTSSTSLRRIPSVQVLPSKGPVHLGPYNPPRVDAADLQRQQLQGRGGTEMLEERIMRPDSNRSSRSVSPSPSQQHSEHNPHVYAPHSVREASIFSTSQSVAASAVSGCANGSHITTSRHSSAGVPVVAVRVLDGPLTASPGDAKRSPTATTVRTHPYQRDEL